MMAVTPERLAAVRSLAFPWGWGLTAAALLFMCGAMWNGQCFDELQRRGGPHSFTRTVAIEAAALTPLLPQASRHQRLTV